MRPHSLTPARTHLTRFQFLQCCKTQVMLDKSGRRRERWFHLKLFCLSAPPQLLNADPYYTPATSWREGDGSGEGCGQGRRKVMRKWDEPHRALQRRKDKSNRRRGGLSFAWCHTMRRTTQVSFLVSNRRQLSFSTLHPLDARSKHTILVPVCAPMGMLVVEPNVARCMVDTLWEKHHWPKIMF